MNIEHLKIQLVRETANFYNIHKRALYGGDCAYCDAGRRMCAIGRILEEEALKEIVEGDYNTGFSIDSLSGVVRIEFKEPYQGLADETEFLQALQKLHDSPNNWDEKGLSPSGKRSAMWLINQVQDGLYEI